MSAHTRRSQPVHTSEFLKLTNNLVRCKANHKEIIFVHDPLLSMLPLFGIICWLNNIHWTHTASHVTYSCKTIIKWTSQKTLDAASKKKENRKTLQTEYINAVVWTYCNLKFAIHAYKNIILYGLIIHYVLKQSMLPSDLLNVSTITTIFCVKFSWLA